MSGIPELLRDLELPIRSFRIFALEGLIREGQGDEVIQTLERRLSIEDDGECRSLLEYALAAVRERTNPVQGTRPASSAEFVQRYSSLDPKSKIVALSNLPPEFLVELSPSAAEWFSQESDSFLRAALLKTFRTVWPRESLRELLKALTLPSLAIRLAALETLVCRAPQELQRSLPNLLTHEDPRIRALGVHGLATIDEDEAVAHLARMLESSEPGAILAALRCSVFLPFEKLRIHFLRTIIDTTDETILDWVAEFLSNNPDPEVPFRLSEIEFRSVGAKKAIIARITNRVTEDLERSRLLGTQWPAFREKLTRWRTERLALVFVQNLLQQWLDGDLSQSKAADALAPDWSKPEIQSALRRSLPGIPSGETRSALETWLQSGLPPKAETPAAPSQPASVAEDSFDERLGKLTTSDKDEARRIIFPILETSSKAPITAKAAAVRAAHRIGLADGVRLVRPLLRSNDPVLAVYVLKYLAAFDFDELVPHLGSFLRAENNRLRFTALRILRDHDQQQSLSVLRTMFRDPKNANLEEALGCLVVFEFSQVRDILLNLLGKAQSKELFARALLLFETNPVLENLYFLFCLEKDLAAAQRSEFAKQVANVREETLQFLITYNRMQDCSRESLEKEFAQRRSQESQEKKIHKPYSVRTLYPSEDDLWGNLRLTMKQLFTLQGAMWLLGAPVRTLSEGWKEYRKTTIFCLVVLSGMLFAFTRPAPPPTTIKRAQPAVAQVLSVDGVVQNPIGTNVVLRSRTGTVYLLHPAPGASMADVSPGTNVRATVIPYRIEADSSIRAECRNLVVQEAPK